MHAGQMLSASRLSALPSLLTLNLNPKTLPPTLNLNPKTLPPTLNLNPKTLPPTLNSDRAGKQTRLPREQRSVPLAARPSSRLTAPAIRRTCPGSSAPWSMSLGSIAHLRSNARLLRSGFSCQPRRSRPWRIPFCVLPAAHGMVGD
eukprot:45646-Chlamydomonas_euryale.AAC.1